MIIIYDLHHEESLLDNRYPFSLGPRQVRVRAVLGAVWV